MTSLRPDRAFSATPVNTPKELFKTQFVDHPTWVYRPILICCRETYRGMYYPRANTGVCPA